MNLISNKFNRTGKVLKSQCRYWFEQSLLRVEQGIALANAIGELS